MDRSRFPDGVPHIGNDFAFESESRMDDHQRLQVDGFQTGIINGFTCSFNNPPTDGDVIIDPGEGYTGDVDYGSKVGSQYGSYLKTTSQKVVSEPGPGWTVGTKYYVLIVLNTVDTIERPSEDGTIEVVREEGSNQVPTAEVLTEAAYIALSDAEKHKRLKVAYFIPTSPITDANIVNAWEVNRIKTSNQPSTVTGVEIREIASITPSGDGSLFWDVSASELSWKAPGDASYGTAVSITADGVYTLESDTASYTLEVFVSIILLPTVDKTDIITIDDLYEGVVRPCSGADRVLRSYGGSALKTRVNPLGLTVDDLGGGIFDLTTHRLLQHDVGITGGAGVLLCSIVNASEDYILAGFLGASDRFYVAGKIFDALAGSRSPITPGLDYSLKFSEYSGDNFSLFEVFVDEYGYLDKSQRAKITSSSFPAVAGLIPLEVYLEDDTGTFDIDWDVGNNSIIFDGGEEIFLYPNVDMVYTFKGQNGKDYLKAYIDWSIINGIGSNQSDTWTVINESIETDYKMPICNVCYKDGNVYGDGSTWATGGDGSPFDARIFGTTSVRNLSNDVKDYIADTVADILNNGVLSGCALSGGGGDTLTVADGEVFVRGRRVYFETDSHTFTGTGNFHIFIDAEGSLQVIDSASSTVAQLNYMCKQMCFIAFVDVSAGPSVAIIDRRAKPGVGSLWDNYSDENLLSMAESFGVSNIDRSLSSRIYSFGNNSYLAFNLIYDYVSGNWSLEDLTKDGYAIIFGSPGSGKDGIATYFLGAGSSPGALSTCDIATEGVRLQGGPFSITYAGWYENNNEDFSAGRNYINTGIQWAYNTLSYSFFATACFDDVPAGGNLIFEGIRREAIGGTSPPDIWLVVNNMGTAVNNVGFRSVIYRVLDRA